MELKGKIFQVMPVESGEGKKGTWYKRTIVIETESEYPKKVAILLWNDLANNFDYQKGDRVDFAINVESREYNGKWFTDVSAFKINSTDAERAVNKQPTNNKPTETKISDDDLPF